MNYVYIAVSLDGFIAKTDGDIEWLHECPNPNNDDYGYAEFIDNIDAIVMGRYTYEKVLTFDEWPYSKKVFVLSSTLTMIPVALIDKVEIISGTAKAIVSKVKGMGYMNLYIDGGSVIQSFLEKDLIDELIVTRIPILLGDGIPLFGRLKVPLKFNHSSTTVYGGALVKTHYRRNNK